MRRSIGRKTWKTAVVIFLLLIAGIYLSARFFSQSLSVVRVQPAEGEYSARVAAFIWKQWYPSPGGAAGGATGGKEGESADSGGWLIQFILRQGPYYRMTEKGNSAGRQQEIDPAYRDYVENNRTLKEYEYLVKGLSESAVLTLGSNPLTAENQGMENLTAGDRGAGSQVAGGQVAGGQAAGGQAAGGQVAGGLVVGSQGTGSQVAGGQVAGDLEAGSQVAGNQNPGNETAGNSLTGGMGTADSQTGTGISDRTGLTVTGTQYIEAQLADYDFLMKHFYSVHPTTTAGRDMMKAETFLSEDLSLKADNGKPQILIYHTHSQEEFADYGPGNKDATIVSVGTYLTDLLTEKGYNVIHDTSVYDLQNGKLDRSRAYNYALDGVTGILQKYPSIEVVLDVHRDGVKAGTHLVQEVNGKQTASIMFFNGTSQTPTGPIEYLKNPYRAKNLAFSFQMKLCADAYFPGFTRKIYLKGMRYNMHLRPRSALIEVGAQTNTYEEARNAMEPLSELLDMVLKAN